MKWIWELVGLVTPGARKRLLRSGMVLYVAGPRDYRAGTRAALFTLAQGTSYFPGCQVPVVRAVEGYQTINVEIAHIRGANPGSRGFDPSMSDPERASFDNLVLLALQAPPPDHQQDRSERLASRSPARIEDIMRGSGSSRSPSRSGLRRNSGRYPAYPPASSPRMAIPGSPSDMPGERSVGRATPSGQGDDKRVVRSLRADRTVCMCRFLGEFGKQTDPLIPMTGPGGTFC